MFSSCDNCQTSTSQTTYKGFKFCWECYDHYREAEMSHPAYQAKARSIGDPALLRAIDKFDELVFYIKDREQYFAKAKENVESARDGEYDYYEGAEEAYGHLAQYVVRLKGEML